MKQDKYRKARRGLNNRGFSLIELLISIAVLVIIMVPLMSNFFRSMQINKKAEQLQVQSNLAASIMEGLKASSIEDIIGEFNRPTSPTNMFDLISEPVDDVMRLEYVDSVLGESFSTSKQTTYYYAIHGVQVGSSVYDAFITVDSEAYKAEEGKMNKYPMPEVANLDADANGLVFSDGTSKGLTVIPSMDDNALSNFEQWGRTFAQTKLEQTTEYQTYLDYLDKKADALIAGTPLPPAIEQPILESYAVTHSDYLYYFDPVQIKNQITKTMKITVNDKTLTYDIEYVCEWPVENSLQPGTVNNIQNSIVNQISVKQYPKSIENVYLFYTPSIFQAVHSADVVEIQNDDLTNPVNLFVAQQAIGVIPISNTVIIRRNDSSISAFTDIPYLFYSSYINATEEPGEGTVNSKVLKTKEQDRIYDITINICKYEDVLPKDRYHIVEYTLESTMEK